MQGRPSIYQLLEQFGYDHVYSMTAQNIEVKRALLEALEGARALYHELVVADNTHDEETAHLFADAIWTSDNGKEIDETRRSLRTSEAHMAILSGDKEAEKIDFESVKAGVRLHEVIRSYGIAARPDGNGRYKVRCPFHHEKEPSLTIYDDTSFYCFGCQAAGDVITFVQKMDGCTAVEAARKLS